MNINQLRIFRINIVPAGYLCLSTKGGLTPPRPTSVPSEHMSDLALGWPAARGGGSAAGVCPPRYNYRHQPRNTALLAITINTHPPTQVYIDWVNAPHRDLFKWVISRIWGKGNEEN